MREMKHLFIGGKWRAPSSSDVIQVIDAADESLLGTVPAAGKADVDAAVMAARQALGKWAETPVALRAELLEKTADNLKARAPEIAEVISREVGMSLKMSQRIQAVLPVIVTASYAKLLQEFPFEIQIANSRVFRVPKGVVAAITPWNYPLHQLVGKVAPALAAGCTVVAKPASEAPLSAFSAGGGHRGGRVSPRRVQSGHGRRPHHGRSAGPARRGRYDLFYRVHRHRRQNCRRGGRVGQESHPGTGGQVALTGLEDADFPKALRSTVNNCFLNSGQTCNALTRLLVPRDRLAEVEEQVAPLVAGMKLGDPGDPDTKLGPLVSARQRERVRQYIREAIQAGTRLLVGGAGSAPGARPGVLCQAHRVHGCRSRRGDCPGGGLRAGPLHHRLPGGGGGGGHCQRDALRLGGGGVVGGYRAGLAGGQAYPRRPD